MNRNLRFSVRPRGSTSNSKFLHKITLLIHPALVYRIPLTHRPGRHSDRASGEIRPSTRPQNLSRGRRHACLFFLWRKVRRENSAASRLLGTTSLRFALHGWQRKNLIAIYTGSSLLIYRIHGHKFQGEFHSKRRGSLCNKHHSKPYAGFTIQSDVFNCSFLHLKPHDGRPRRYIIGHPALGPTVCL